MPQAVQGVLEVDHQPISGAEVALLDDTGKTVAAAQSDAAGRFAFATAGTSVVGKLHAPVIGAAYASVAGGPVTLTAAARDAATLTVAIELPADAAAVGWFDVELTPHMLIGVPASAVQALTLDGTGPAQRANYHKARVAEPRIMLRVQPGSWDLKVSHIVERGKPMRAAPPNWLGSSAALPDGRVVEADLGRMRIDIARDLAVRVAMRTVAD